jgi:tetratricopeptide (TPR) repeat protein
MLEFRDSQKLALDHAGAHLSLASADRRHGRIQEAHDHLRRAIALEPYLTGARGELASLLQDHGGDPAEIKRLRAEEADLLDRDAKIAPDNATIFYRLGLLRYLLEEYDKADAAFQKACEKASQNYDFRMVLALLQKKRYEDTGDVTHYNETIKSLAKLHELNKNDERGKQIYFELQQARQRHDPAPPKKPDDPTQ